MNGGAVEDLCGALNSVHSSDVGLGVVGVDLGDADLWETRDLDGVVRVPDQLGLRLVKVGHARREFGLERVI